MKTPATPVNEGEKLSSPSFYPAPVRYSRLSSLGIKPFWIVPFCFLSGGILFLLRGFVLNSRSFYSALHPLMIPLFIVGLGLIVARRVLHRNPNRLLTVGNTVGYILLFIALFMLFFFDFGLVSLWTLPFDLVSADTYRQANLDALSYSPAAIRLYERYLARIGSFKLLKFDDGIGGAILNFKDYLVELLKDDEVSLVKRIVKGVTMLLLGFFLAVLIAIVFPGVCLLLPFILSYLCCIIIDRLLRIGLGKS